MKITAVNDNDVVDDSRVQRAETIRHLRSQGFTFRDIANRLDIGLASAHRAINRELPRRPPLAANDNKVVRDVPFNGGWSTNSGMAKVSLPRVPTLERRAIALDAIEERMAA